MNIQLRQTTDWFTIKSLHDDIFPSDNFDENIKRNTAWLARNGKNVIGFCMSRPLSDDPGTLFLSRAGLISEARGKGLQRRMIKVRFAYAKKHGFKKVITYVHRDNIQSAVNLERCGFRLYAPAEEWAGKNFLYFMRSVE